MEHLPEVVVKKRDNGTRSSVNQVDDMGKVHGFRVTYFADGKTIYSKQAFKHGIKNGPFIRYYNNGQIFQHTHYEDGKRHGLTRKYYKDGKLLAEFEHENGNMLPGLKEYDKNGNMLTSYPEIQFREVDHLASKNRIDLEMFCNEKNRGVKYFLLDQGIEASSRIYLFSDNSSASMQFYVKPGDTLNRRVDILAEIPTYLGNIMLIKLSYQITAVNEILFR